MRIRHDIEPTLEVNPCVMQIFRSILFYEDKVAGVHDVLLPQ